MAITPRMGPAPMQMMPRTPTTNAHVAYGLPGTPR